MSLDPIQTAILADLPLDAGPVTAVRLYCQVNRHAPDLAYGEFHENLLGLERRGLVLIRDVEGTGDDAPELTVRAKA